ncbi:UNVERIFIED_CONTAM: hypothetical protein Cloal_1871 [Acetivibrio alkalicellulosi]
MSIAGVIIHNDVINEKDYYILLADTRVVNKNNSRGILESSYESALKVIELCPNIIAGICGEYQILSVLKDISEEFKENPNIIIDMDINLLSDKIHEKIIDSFNLHMWSDTDMFLMVQDEKTKITKVYKYIFPDGQRVELKEGLHIIGGSAQLRAEIKKKYQTNFKEQEKCSFYTPNYYANQLLVLLKEIVDEDIGNDFITYYSDPKGGIRTLANYTIFKADAKIVSMRREENIWEKRINSDISSELTNNIDLINEKLRKSFKSK